MKRTRIMSLENSNDQELMSSFENMGIRSSKEAVTFYRELDLGGDYYPTWGCSIPLSVKRDYG
ncbi:MAG: hypothetical protein SGI94_00660 [Saprospiraceae bacterium]|nr:hypothetical protein [Saprospiraceae bacterium]